MLALINPQWKPLAEALRDGGVPGPDDLDWDIPRDGRVSGDRALLVWTRVTPFVALVDRALAPPDGFGRLICTEPGADATALAAELRGLLEEVSQ